ncbi:MAG: hypothetical protein ACJAR8_001392 [Bacteroidia bacterium]
MRKIFSIALVLLLTFIGISNMLHALETQENHCHNSGEHICLEDDHHHCTLCDTVLLPAIAVAYESADNVIQYIEELTPFIAITPLSLLVKSPYGRAPPIV